MNDTQSGDLPQEDSNLDCRECGDIDPGPDGLCVECREPGWTPVHQDPGGSIAAKPRSSLTPPTHPRSQEPPQAPTPPVDPSRRPAPLDSTASPLRVARAAALLGYYAGRREESDGVPLEDCALELEAMRVTVPELEAAAVALVVARGGGLELEELVAGVACVLEELGRDRRWGAL